MTQSGGEFVRVRLGSCRGFGNGAFEDSEEDSHAVIEEFFTAPEPASSTAPVDSQAAPKFLADKLEALASQPH